MKITVNGQIMEIAEGTTARHLLENLKIKGPLALELNQTLCPKERYDQTYLKESDILEIVTIVGGG